jgi:hypothetical protein
MPAAASTVALVQSVLRPDHNLLDHPSQRARAGAEWLGAGRELPRLWGRS